MGQDPHEKDLLLNDGTIVDEDGDAYDDTDVQSSTASYLTRPTIRKEMLKSYFNVVCTMAGTGILQLSFTLHQGGWMMLALLVLVAVMALYTGLLVMDNLYRPSGRLAGYPETGEAAFGMKGKIVVQVFQKATLLGVSTLFLILAAGFMRDCYDQADSSNNPTKKQWTLIAAALVAFPTLCLANVDALSFTSALGGFVTVGGVVGVIVLSITHEPSGEVGHTTINVSNFPIAFSAVCLSFGGHACFPTIQHNMAKVGVGRKRFKKVLNWSFLTLLLFYVPVAFVGYYIYGDDVKSPIVDSLPISNPGTITIKLAMLVNTLLTFPILQHVVFSEIEDHWNLIPEDGRYLTSLDMSIIAPRLALRSACLAFSTIVAYFVPYFDDFMSLVGALCVTMMVFVLPCVFAIRLHEMEREEGPRSSRVWWWYAWMTLIMIVGTVGGGVGVEQSVSNLISDVKNHKE